MVDYEKKQYWSYWINKEKRQMAFCMPYENDWDQTFKIVWRQNKGAGKVAVGMLVKRRFKSRDLAQERLDKIAESKGWEKAFA